jgi:hypothetical protein
MDVATRAPATVVAIAGRSLASSHRGELTIFTTKECVNVQQQPAPQYPSSVAAAATPIKANLSR